MNQANWLDRRPIVRCDIATSFWQWYNNQQNTPTYGPLPGITRSGTELDNWFSAYADTNIVTAKKVNAQGVFIADSNLEDGENLIGDVRERNALFPLKRMLMFTGKIKAAGYKIGFCVRPGIQVRDVTGNVEREVAEEWVMGDLYPKIKAAVDLFGASIFYVDSNVQDDFTLDPRTIVDLRNRGGAYTYNQMLISFEHWSAPGDGIWHGWGTPDYFGNGCGYFAPNHDVPPPTALWPDATKDSFCLLHPLDPVQWNEAFRQNWIDSLAWGHIPLVVGGFSGSTFLDRINECRKSAGLV